MLQKKVIWRNPLFSHEKSITPFTVCLGYRISHCNRDPKNKMVQTRGKCISLIQNSSEIGRDFWAGEFVCCMRSGAFYSVALLSPRVLSLYFV